MRRRSVAALLWWVFLAAGCGDDPVAPDTMGFEAPGALFYEPHTVCLIRNRSVDSLAVYNLGDTTLVWTLVHAPRELTGLPGRLELPPGTARILPWQWTPSGPYPVLDSLVAESNDPRRPRISIPFRREDPAATGLPVVEPAPPVLGGPPSGTVASFPDTVITLFWSRASTCTERAFYTVEVAEELPFPPEPESVTVTGTAVDLVFAGDGSDRGVVLHWRVRLSDGQLTGPPGPHRTVEHR